MTWDPYPPLPSAALRDLLGITRALYRSTAEADPTDPRLAALEDIGKTLRAALRGAREHPGTIAHGQAWAAAERATKALKELVGPEMLLAPLVEATARNVSRRGSMR